MINHIPTELLGLNIRSEEFKQSIKILNLSIHVPQERTRTLYLENGVSINIDLKENVMGVGALLKTHGLEDGTDIYSGELPIQNTQLTRDEFQDALGKPLSSVNYSTFLGQEVFPFDEYSFDKYILHLRFDKNSKDLVLIAIKNT